MSRFKHRVTLGLWPFISIKDIDIFQILNFNETLTRDVVSFEELDSSYVFCC